jgi:NADH-quinone oxidoreductase subunit G
MIMAGRPEARAWENFDSLVIAVANSLPIFKPIPEIAPPASFRIAGQKIPREPHRYSGRTSMNAAINVNEPKPPEDPDSPLAFSMEGFPGQPPPALIPHYWAPGWNSVQSVNKFQAEVGGELRGGDPGIRLIEPAMTAKPNYFREIPEPFSPQGGRWLLLPIHHIFGSEELSLHSPSIAELAPKPYLALNAEDAERLRIMDGQEIEVRFCGMKGRLRIKRVPGLPKGVAAVPAGLSQLQGVSLPAWTKLGAANSVELS